MTASIARYYRCPEEYLRFAVDGELSAEPGFFSFGKDLRCYGRLSRGSPSISPAGHVFDAIQYAKTQNGIVQLPFAVDRLVQAFACEEYVGERGKAGAFMDAVVASAYYFVRPLLSVEMRKHLQKLRLKGWETIPFPSWPVDFSMDNLMRRLLLLTLEASGAEKIPFIWFWPDGASSCAIMTHDVETASGRDFCSTLMDINDSFDIKASFQVVPEKRYEVPIAYLDSIRTRGFEVNVQDLNHDGHLYKNHEIFRERVDKINAYGRAWDAVGFRAGILYRNQKWFNELAFEYDMSVPNVAHLDPQRGGCCSVMPYFIGDILEIPVTTTQDYSLFHILNDYSLDVWKQQTELIMNRHGLMSFIVHPDYVVADRARNIYRELLGHLSNLRDERAVWLPKPAEVNRWWRQRANMTLVREGNGWRIVGEGSARAKLAYAYERDGRLEVTVESSVTASSH